MWKLLIGPELIPARETTRARLLQLLMGVLLPEGKGRQTPFQVAEAAFFGTPTDPPDPHLACAASIPTSLHLLRMKPLICSTAVPLTKLKALSKVVADQIAVCARSGPSMSLQRITHQLVGQDLADFPLEPSLGDVRKARFSQYR